MPLGDPFDNTPASPITLPGNTFDNAGAGAATLGTGTAFDNTGSSPATLPNQTPDNTGANPATLPGQTFDNTAPRPVELAKIADNASTQISDAETEPFATRWLVIGATNGGIYNGDNGGTNPPRATDYDSQAEIQEIPYVFVLGGVNAGKWYFCTAASWPTVAVALVAEVDVPANIKEWVRKSGTANTFVNAAASPKTPV